MSTTPRRDPLRSPLRGSGWRRPALSLAAATLVGTVLPWSTTPAAHAAAGDPAFSGFSTSAAAAPVRIELYEPTIPLPASPQAELNFAYSTVEADSSSSHGRASWLWPGDPAGEGLKTIMEQAGAKDLATEYPLQVNSSSPSGESSQADEPFPFTVMRTAAGPERTVATAGVSPDGTTQDPEEGDGGGGGTPSPPGQPPLPVPGAPGLPATSGSPAGDQLQAFGQAITGQQSAAAGTSTSDADPGAPGLPPELTALVDFTGYTSTSETRTGADRIATSSRSAVSDVELLGGVITIADVHGRTLTTSNGAKGKPSGRAGYGTLAIAGNEFTIGPDGVAASGRQQAIPGLPDNAAAALAQLGVTLTVPKPTYTREGDQATSAVEGLRVEIDTAQLRSKLDSVPFDQIVGAVPDETGQLKSLLGAAVHLSPRFVITLGTATSQVDTVQGIELPTVPTTDPGAGGAAGGSTGGGSGSGAATSASGASAAAPPGSAGPAADGDLGDVQPVAAGLPPLFSIPGVLLFGGLALATVAGSYARKIGALALGGAGFCSHGLESGLPDLRKA